MGGLASNKGVTAVQPPRCIHNPPRVRLLQIREGEERVSMRVTAQQTTVNLVVAGPPRMATVKDVRRRGGSDICLIQSDPDLTINISTNVTFQTPTATLAKDTTLIDRNPIKVSVVMRQCPIKTLAPSSNRLHELHISATFTTGLIAILRLIAVRRVTTSAMLSLERGSFLGIPPPAAITAPVEWGDSFTLLNHVTKIMRNCKGTPRVVGKDQSLIMMTI